MRRLPHYVRVTHQLSMYQQDTNEPASSPATGSTTKAGWLARVFGFFQEGITAAIAIVRKPFRWVGASIVAATYALVKPLRWIGEGNTAIIHAITKPFRWVGGHIGRCFGLAL